MYKLILEPEERSAIDWIGYRYFHGDDLFQLLLKCEHTPEDAEWDSEETITYNIPEHIAWQIEEGIAEENYSFACLDSRGTLVTKLIELCNSIV